MVTKSTQLSVIIISIIIFTLGFSGCGKKSLLKNKTDLAMVDNYNISISDYQMKKAELSPYIPENNDNKQNILNLLIDNTLLLKEAEICKINQSPEFLKTIEHFWRQSLIQHLLNKKIIEIRESTRIPLKDIVALYDKLKFKYEMRIIKYTTNSNIILPQKEKEIDSYIERNSKQIDSDSEWFIADLFDIPSEVFFYFKNNTIKDNIWNSIDSDGTTFAFFIKNTQANNIQPFEKMKDAVERLLKEQTEQTALNEWMKSLRIKSDIIINKELLKKLLL